jgi:PAS domain S-box-containing protein
MGDANVQMLLGLSGLSATTDDPARILADSLPVLAELGQAAAVLVVRRDATGLTVAHGSGSALDAAEIDPGEGSTPGALREVPVPEDWRAHGIGSVAAMRLPGHEGVLALAWTGEPQSGDELGIAAATVASGLARAVVATELRDLAARVNNAQHLAHMGDYDWHIPSDTNRWSDELFRIYGHDPQSFNPSYERFLSLIHPDDRERITGVHQQAYATGEPYEMMERIVRPDGEVRYLDSNGEVVMDEHGVPLRMRGTCIDITDRVLAERGREHLDARYRSLVEAAPDAILVIDPSGHVLDANPQAREMLRGDPMRRWVGDLGTLDADGLGVELTRLDGSVVTVDVTRAEINPDEGDAALVAVFLRDSAARLAGEELAAHQSQAQLRRRQALEINDNVVQGLVAAAYALDAEQLPVVATYLDRTLTSARLIMDDLLEPLDGTDLVPGDLVRSNPATLGEPATTSAGTTSGPDRSVDGHRVLVVDDADDLRALLCERIERADGYVVVGEAADGLTAVELARDLQPDVVLLDLAMPRMDGLEALPRIREAVTGVRVIVFSGFNQNTLAQKALDAGADRYVVKGGPMRDLVALLESVLQPS